MSRRLTDPPSAVAAAEFQQWVTDSRLAQGLPPRIEDPAVYARLAHLLVTPDDLEPHLVEGIPATHRRTDDDGLHDGTDDSTPPTEIVRLPRTA